MIERRRNMWMFESSAIYCRRKIFARLETKIKRRTLNPKWNETFYFEGNYIATRSKKRFLALSEINTETALKYTRRILIQFHKCDKNKN